MTGIGTIEEGVIGHNFVGAGRGWGKGVERGNFLISSTRPKRGIKSEEKVLSFNIHCQNPAFEYEIEHIYLKKRIDKGPYLCEKLYRLQK